MDTNDLIKNVIQENVVETKKLAHELLMQKLSERLQQKFDEYAPNTFLDEESEEETEELDENLYRNELNSLLEKKHKEEKEEEEEEEEEMGEDGLVYEDGDDEEMGEDGLVYEDEGCEHCDDENEAEEMNKKAFGNTGLSEGLKGKQHELDVAEPKGKLTAADFKKLRNKKK